MVVVCYVSNLNVKNPGVRVITVLGQKSEDNPLSRPTMKCSTIHTFYYYYTTNTQWNSMKNSSKCSLSPWLSNGTDFPMGTLDLISGVPSFGVQHGVDPIIHGP
jgi:hypothetical protein